MRVFTFGQLNLLRREANRLKKEKNISHGKAVDEMPRAPARRPRVKRTEARGMFHQWLSDQERRLVTAEDLARMGARDPQFPISTDDIEILRGYLRKVGAKEREAFEEDWEGFLEDVR